MPQVSALSCTISSEMTVLFTVSRALLCMCPLATKPVDHQQVLLPRPWFWVLGASLRWRDRLLVPQFLGSEPGPDGSLRRA